jgi:hypothetical protein
MGKIETAVAWSEADVVKWASKGAPCVSSREEIAAIFSIDRTDGVVDRATVESLAKAISHWMVWVQRPTGAITEEACDWLIAVSGDRPTTFGRAVLFAVVREADTVPERLSVHVMKASVGRALLI